MAAGPSIDLSGWFDEQLAQASPDLLRGMVQTFAEALMGAEVDAACGAGYGVRSEERTNKRNGYRAREWDTRAATMELAIPKLRTGSYFPGWLLERQRRAEAALVSVVATCYLLGVSTRRMDRLVHTLGITSLSKSQVSEMAKSLDEQVAAFRTRPLAGGPYTFVAADALVLKVREAHHHPRPPGPTTTPPEAAPTRALALARPLDRPMAQRVRARHRPTSSRLNPTTRLTGPTRDHVEELDRPADHLPPNRSEDQLLQLKINRQVGPRIEAKFRPRPR